MNATEMACILSGKHLQSQIVTIGRRQEFSVLGKFVCKCCKDVFYKIYAFSDENALLQYVEGRNWKIELMDLLLEKGQDLENPNPDKKIWQYPISVYD